MQALADCPVSVEALNVLGVLREAGAHGRAAAMPDRTIAERAGVAVRSVIEFAEELAAIDVAVLATCGDRASNRKGRYLETDPRAVRRYAEQLHGRARAIHGRAKAYSDLAERMEQKRMPAETTGQRKLFA